MSDTSTAAASDELENEYLLIDAETAQGSVGVLIELIDGCKPGQQVTAIFMRSFLVDVKMHLDNVVDGLRSPEARLQALAAG